MSADAAEFDLVVVEGPDHGARFRVGRQPIVLGRGGEADVTISDARVSRLHAQAVASDAGVVFAMLPTARRPIVYRGQSLQFITVPLGEELRVGDTILRVETTLDGAVRPAANTLLTGEAEDVRASAALYQLSDGLRRALDRPSIEGVVRAWATTPFVRARDASFVEPTEGEVPLPDGQLAVGQAGDRGSRVLVPLPGVVDARLAVIFDVPPERIAESLQRLLFVCGMIVAGRVAMVDTLSRLKDDRDFVRGRAFGSASRFVGASASAERVEERIARLSAADVTVFIGGETGTGKTFVARLLHERSRRKDGPFRVINCASIPDNLLESELFGVEKGAYTGATVSRPGAFEVAEGGTLFLDEVGELSPQAQAKLLRALEERCFERVGSTKVRKLSARVVTATNRDLAKLVREGTFREDLYYRVCVHTLAVPPLRERREDIAVLATKFLEDLAPLHGRRATGFTPEVLAAFAAYPWPGNVRELRNVIEYALINGDGPVLDKGALPDVFHSPSQPPRFDAAARTVTLPVNQTWLDTKNFEAAMEVASGNVTRAAAILGMNRVSVHKRLRRTGGGSQDG
jgi:transcriptional regulator with GAF, ATPase, and Fis domain